MAISNVKGIDAIFVEIPLLNPNHFLACRRANKYTIHSRLSCDSKNVIYLVSCKKCRLQYIGSTTTDFRIRFRNHKSAMLTNKTTCEVAVHFNKIPHILDDFSFQCIDQVQAPNNSDEIDRLLITKEAYWSAQLFSLAPHGLNKGKEFHSRNRICYNQFSFLRFFVRDIWPFKGPFLGFC